MAPILQRLQSCVVGFPDSCDEGTKNWSFHQKIDNKNADFFRDFVKNHPLLGLEYSVHCTQLAHDLLHKDKSELTQQIEAALIMAELLEHIYRDYLIVPGAVARFRREQAVYRSLLDKQGYHFSNDIQNDIDDVSVSKIIREITFPANFSRQLIARIRRFLLAVVPVLNSYNSYTRCLERIDVIANPLLAYGGWIFFIPRVFTNLYLTGKHVIPGFWMGTAEKSMGFQTRFRAQMERRWFELGNDLAAMTVNVLNCFIFVGVLAPIGIYATAALLTYDVGLASLRTYIEMSRLKKLEEQYKAILQDGKLSAVELEQTRSYLSYLEQRIHHEQKRLCIQVLNTVLLLLTFSLAFPFFAFNPIIPMIGAALTVLASVSCFTALRCVDNQKPVDKISPEQTKQLGIVTYSLFKPSSMSTKPSGDGSVTPRQSPC